MKKMKGKIIEDIKKRVTSIDKQLGRKVEFREVVEAMAKGFEENFGVSLVKEDLTQEEKDLAVKIREERFSTENWNFMR